MPSTFTFDPAAFRLAYPQFADSATWPTITLQMYFDTATLYISNRNCGVLNGDRRFLALNLFTAHLAALSIVINSGDLPNLPQSATVDKVSVSLTPPPLQNEFEWWLNLTPYGQQLLVLLSIASVGGLMFGGSPNRPAFRGAAGFRW